MAHIQVVSEDPEYKAPMRKLIDYREIEGARLSPEESEIFAGEKAARGTVFQGEKSRQFIKIYDDRMRALVRSGAVKALFKRWHAPYPDFSSAGKYNP